MAKNRVRLEICGVHCSLITDESEEYMQSLAKETEDMMNMILKVPAATVEIAAVTSALSFLDESKKSKAKAEAALKPETQEKLKKVLEEYNSIKSELNDSEKRIKALTENETKLKEGLKKAQTAENDNSELDEAKKKIEKLESELKEIKSQKKEDVKAELNPTEENETPKHHKANGKLRNPMRPMDDYEQQGMVSFFEKK